MSARIERSTLRSTLSSLLYLDRQILTHLLRRLMREPKRFLPWLGFLAFLGFLILADTFSEGEATSSGIILLIAPLLPSLFLILVGVIILFAARRPPAIFIAPADGSFLAGSGLPSRPVVLWLLARSFITHLVAYIPVIIWISVISASSIGVRGMLTRGTALALTLIIVLGLRIPIGVRARRRGGAPFVVLGLASIIAGLGGIGLAFMKAHLAGGALITGISEFAPNYPPGSWVLGTLHGDGISTLFLSITALGAIALTIITAGDALPELWEASTRAFALRAAAQQRGPGSIERVEGELRRERSKIRSGGRGRRGAGDASWHRIPSGAWTLLWKEWLARSRRTNLIPAPIWQGALGLALGAALGIASHHTAEDTFAGMMTGGLFTLLILGTMQGNVRLAGDLGKPLWWLSSASMRARLAVYLLASTLIWTIPIGGGLTLFAIVTGQIPLAVWAIPLVGATYWLIQSSALLIYSGLPAGSMMSPPIVMLRFFSVFLLIIPVAIVAVGVALVATMTYKLNEVITAQLVLGTVTAAAIAEGWLLVHLASIRMRERGLEFAITEKG